MIYNLTAAVIGSGRMGKQHLEVLKKCVKNLIICTNDIETGKALAAENNLTFYDNYSEMFEKERLDFVSICLPTPLHHDATLEAIKHGINVLCEKPFAQSSDQAKQILDAANKKGVTLMIGHCLRFFKPYEVLKRCIADKRYGKLLYLDLFRHSTKPNWSVGSWLENPKISGGVTRDLNIHDTDIVLNLFGMPTALSTTGNASVCKTVYYFKDSDISVSSGASWRNADGYKPFVGFDAVFENATLSLQGKKTSFNSSNPNDSNPFKTEVLPDCFKRGSNDFIKTEILYFCDCLCKNKKPELCPPEDSYKTMLINDAQIESLNTKKTIKLN